MVYVEILSTPSFGGEVKPSLLCRRFAACKRSLKWRGSRHFGKITGQYSRPQFHLPPLGSLASWRTWGHLVTKVGTSKRRGKQWQTTPKNLPRMQRTRAIPVAWLSSSLCPDRSKGWIPIIIITTIIVIMCRWQVCHHYASPCVMKTHFSCSSYLIRNRPSSAYNLKRFFSLKSYLVENAVCFN
jgi:hypothetical protein